MAAWKNFTGAKKFFNGEETFGTAIVRVYLYARHHKQQRATALNTVLRAVQRALPVSQSSSSCFIEQWDKTLLLT